MLKKLKIKNLAIIDLISLEFSNGLNILTGETGSGKSIIVNAIDLLMGGKFSKENFRNSTDAEISGEFIFGKKNIIIKKVFNVSGNHKIFINNELVSNTDLRLKTKNYIDMHGQYNQHSILNFNNHIDFLDNFGDYDYLLSDLNSLFDKYQENKNLLIDLESMNNDIVQKQELYHYQLEELNQIELYVGIDDTLSSEYAKISNIEEIRKSIDNLNILIDERDEGVQRNISEIIKLLDRISNFDKSFSTFTALFEEIEINIKEAHYDLNTKKNEFIFDQEIFDKLSSQLEHIEMIKRKYGGTIDSAISYKEEVAVCLDDLNNIDGKIDKLKLLINKDGQEIEKLSEKISDKRIKNIPVFEKNINAILSKLNMKDALLEVKLERLEKIGYKGFNVCEFYISTNKGQKVKPVVKIASGGEVSRIMLAIKILMQNKIKKNTLIFDEIDLGISGITAENLGNNILNLSKKTQIVCISHLPQIASKGECHYRVFKHLDNNETLSSVVRLSYKERINEIAKMLSGKHITDSSLNQAKYLLDA